MSWKTEAEIAEALITILDDRGGQGQL